MQETQETLVRSLGLEDSPRVGNGNPLQYSCLENSMNRGAWQATVYGITKQLLFIQSSHLEVKVTER